MEIKKTVSDIAGHIEEALQKDSQFGFHVRVHHRLEGIFLEVADDQSMKQLQLEYFCKGFLARDKKSQGSLFF